MDRLTAISLFVSVVEQGSLAAASRKAGCSTATVTRAVALLEAHLGQRLLHRSARQTRLTEAGRDQLAIYRTVLSDLAGSGLLDEPARPAAPELLAGHIGITAPELFGRSFVAPAIGAFVRQHPQVRARVLLLNRLVDLVGEGIDVAVRLSRLPDSGLVAVRLGELRTLVCASPAYLGQAGRPAGPADLVRHACLGSNDAQAHLRWRFARSSGAALSVAIQPFISLNSAGAALDLALDGAGLFQGFSYQVADHLRAGRLVTLLEAYEPPATPVHLVFHPIPRRNTVLRAFIDHATPVLRTALDRVHATMQAAADLP